MFIALRRPLLALVLSATAALTYSCGTKDPQPKAADAPVAYTARYSIAGNGTQPYVDRPYCQFSLSACSPAYDNQHPVSCPSGDLNSNELLSSPLGASSTLFANAAATTVALTNKASLSGKTLYLSARFYSAKDNPPASTSVLQIELLANGLSVQTVRLDYNDAQLAANRYLSGGPGVYDVVKYVKFTLP